MIRAAALLAAACTAATAQPVSVEVRGEVGFNVIGGNQSGVATGDPVLMTFLLDATDFVDSPNFPTRGYEIDPSSFELSVGGNPITLVDPQPFGPAFFVIRNDDPAVDGFLVSRNIDLPQPVTADVPGLPTHDLDFMVTYPETTVPSLDLLDAVGDYDFTGISVFNWTVGRFGGIGAEYIYESMTIRVVGPGCNAADIAEPYGVLDLACIQAFVTGFVAQDPIADIAAPFGVYDLADVQFFISEFLAGCP